jgi:hypothetical protein
VRWRWWRPPARGGVLAGRAAAPVGEGARCGPLPAGRPDYARIAVLEWEVLGVRPAPGTAAAVVVGLAEAGERLKRALSAPRDQVVCGHEEVVSVRGLGDARDSGVCTGCGAQMFEGDGGDWTPVKSLRT